MRLFKSTRLHRLASGACSLCLGISTLTAPASAAPVGGQVTAGQGLITQSGTATTIDQQSDRLVIEWQGFDTINGESVTFAQPGSSAWALNRVMSGQATSFDGSLFANGNVIITNGSGIHFGPNAMVDVNSLIASVPGITDANFMAGNMVFDQIGTGDAMVTNAGTITAREGGLAALVAPGVENSGLIKADLGTVVLGGGEAFALDFYGDGLIQFAITEPTKTAPKRADGSDAEAIVSNSGTVQADGGTVVMTAKQASAVLDTAINMSGIAQANSVSTRGGKIVLGGGGAGTVRVSGTARAQSAPTVAPVPAPALNRGRIAISGERVEIADGALIDVSGEAGGGEILIGGGYQGATISDGVLGDLANADTLVIESGARIFADAAGDGDGGTVIAWADGSTAFSGTISAQGGAFGGDGGFVETSGKQALGVGQTARVNTLAPLGQAGNWLLDPTTISISNGGSTTLPAAASDPNDTSNLVIDADAINSATSNVTLLASDSIVFGEAISMTSAGVGLTAEAGNLITVNAGIATNNGDITLISDEFDINAAVNAGTGTLMFGLSTPGAFNIGYAPNVGTGGADIQTDELALLSAANLVFGDPTTGPNKVSLIEIASFPANPSISSSVQYNALGGPGAYIFLSGDQTYPAVEFNARDGVDFSDSQTLRTTVGSIVIDADADTSGVVGGFDDLRAEDGANVTISSAADIMVVAPKINELGTGELWFSANSGAGTISFLRSSTGTIGVGDGAGGDLSFSTAQLSRMSADELVLGNSTITDNNTSAISVLGVDFGGVADVRFNVGGSTGTTFFTGTNKFAAVTTGGAVTSVETNATVEATDTAAFNTASVVLDGNIDAANGITGTASTITVAGSAGGAEIQDAVDLAATGATVNVSAGSYSGFTIDVAGLTIDGANTPTVNASATTEAITIAANDVTVQDVLLQGTGAADEVGILLDGTTASGLTGIDIYNVSFSKLDDGIRSQGNIGTGATADVTIRGTSSTGKSVFEDMLDTAIDVGDTDGNATYVVQDVIVRDGASDTDSVGTGGDGMRFGDVGGATVNRVEISEATSDGIQFGTLDGSSVNVWNSSIVAALDSAGSGSGLNFDGVISNGAQIDISGNSVIESLGGLHGIEFEQAPTGAATTIDIIGNTLIRSAENQGIVFGRGATDVSVTIQGNGTSASTGIIGPADAISVNNAILTNVKFLVGGDTAADGNFISSTNQALDIQGISGGSFIVANNDLLEGAAAIEIEGDVTNGADLVFFNNGNITSTGAGFQFRGDITGNSNVTIAANIFGNTQGNAVVFIPNTVIEDSTVTIGSATVAVESATIAAVGNTMNGSANGNGIRVASKVQGTSDFTIKGNSIGSSNSRVGSNGILFGNGILDTATVTIENNQVYAGGKAILVNDLQSPSTLSIVNGTYNGTGGALSVDNRGVAGTDGRLNIGSAAYTGGTGSNVIEVLTDTGNAGVDIDFTGTASISGGATGLLLSGPGIDVLGNTFGSITFAGQPTTYIQLANGAEFAPGNPTVLDATGVSFDGTLGSAMSTAQLQALETRLLHYPDLNTLGLINTNNLFVVNGESIQTAVNYAGTLVGPQTVSVQDGTFGGSVEVWVDDLTLEGQGATTIIDTDLVDLFANDGDVDNGFGVYAIDTSGINPGDVSGTGDVTGVTIDGFSFAGAGNTNDGVVLGIDGISTAIGTTVSNASFDGLFSAVWAHSISGDTTLDTLVGTDLVYGIDVLSDLAGGATFVLENSDLFSMDDTVRVYGDISGSGTAFTVRNSKIESDGEDGIYIAGDIEDEAVVLIGGLAGADANTIKSRDEGVNIRGEITSGASVLIGNNSLVQGSVAGIAIEDDVEDASVSVIENTQIEGYTAVEFGGEIENSRVNIVGNGEVSGGGNGIWFDDLVFDGSIVSIAGNTLVEGREGDGIHFAAPIWDSTVVIGDASVDISGQPRTFDGNDEIYGLDDGIDADWEIDNSSFTVAGNGEITGEDDAGIEIEGAVVNASTLTIADNGMAPGIAGKGIQGGRHGIRFEDIIADNNPANGGGIAITGNSAIIGGEDGIGMFGPILLSAVDISGNTLIEGQSYDGILVDFGLALSSFSVSGNGEIIGADDGLNLGPNLLGRFEINDNGLVRGIGGSGIEFEGPQIMSVFDIVGNGTIRGGEEGIEFDTLNLFGFDWGLYASSVNIADNPAIVGDTTYGILINNAAGNTISVSNSAATGNISGLAFFNNSVFPQNGFFDIDNTMILSGSTFTGLSGAGLDVRNHTSAAGLEIDLAAGNIFNGNPAMYLSGPRMSLLGDTLGTSAFNGTNGGYFIVLANGGLFEPGRPTIIDGDDATFDGEAPSASNIMAIEDRLHDYDDDKTLGQIFFRNELLESLGKGIDYRRLTISNIQAPGDYILRPNDILHILPQGAFGDDYSIGTCVVVSVSDTDVDLACLLGGGVTSAEFKQFLDNLGLRTNIAAN